MRSVISFLRWPEASQKSGTGQRKIPVYHCKVYPELEGLPGKVYPIFAIKIGYTSSQRKNEADFIDEELTKAPGSKGKEEIWIHSS